MHWEFIIALVIAIPVVAIPMAFVWYLGFVGLYSNTKQAQERRAAARRLVREAIQIIRNRQTVNRAILNALEADEKKQTELGETRGGLDSKGRTPLPGTMSPSGLRTAVEVDSKVAVIEKVVEEPSKIEEVVDLTTGDVCLPPCQIACPMGEPIQRTNTLIAHLPLDAEKAFNQIINIGDEIYEKNPLFTICSYICGLCERQCNYKDETGAIRRRMLKRFLSDYYLSHLETKPPLRHPIKERVAVIGGGPGGLMCAYTLSRKGYQVTILERNPQLGGALRYIPRYRLPPDIVDTTVDNLVRIANIDVRFGIEMGRGRKTLDDLKDEGYRAIFIATGTHFPRPLTFDGQLVSGTELEGVVSGLHFLFDVNHGKTVPKLFHQLFRGKRVIVVGGGNVAFDVARTARRLNADVSIVCLECENKSSKDGIPADMEEIEGAAEEGIKINYCRGIKEIIGENGKFKTIRCPRCVSVFDEKGFNPRFDQSDVIDIEGDLLLVTIGQAAERAFLQQEGLLDEKGRLSLDQLTLMSNHREGIFIGGDTRRAGFAAEAMRDGVTAAESIDRYLRGDDLRADREKRYGSAVLPKLAVYKPQAEFERSPLADILDFDPLEKGFTLDKAVSEAKRCLCCGPCRSCKACVAMGMIPGIPKIEVNQNRCSRCGACIAVCSYDAINLANSNGKRAVIDEIKCKRCGVCSAACPANAITIENFTAAQIMNEIEGVLV